MLDRLWSLQSYACLPCRVNLSEAGLLKQLFTKYATPAIDYIMEGMDAGELVQKVKLTVAVTSLNLITQLCHLLETLLKESGHYTDPNVSSAANSLTACCSHDTHPMQVHLLLDVTLSAFNRCSVFIITIVLTPAIHQLAPLTCSSACS